MKHYSLKHLLLFTVVCHLCFSSQVFGQSAELGELYTKKNEYVQQKDFKNALIWGEKMLAQAKKEFGTEASLYANYANDLGQLYFMTQQYNKALALFQQAAKIYEAQVGKDHLYYGVALNTIANVYYEQKQYAKALANYEAAATIYKNQMGNEHQYYTVTRDRLLEIYMATNQYSKAEKLMEEKLPWTEKQLGKQHDNYAFALGEMAQIYKHNQKYAKAIPFFRQSIKIYGQNSNYENQAATINNLAMLHDQQKNYAKAIKRFDQSLNILEHKLNDTQSENYLQTLSNLVQTLTQLNRSTRLEKLYLKLLALQKTKGLSKEYLINTYNLGSYYQDIYQYDKAEKQYLEVIKAYRQQPKVDDTYIKSLNNLGIIYTTNGQYAQAEKLVKEGLQKQVKSYGKNHRDYVSLLTGLGDLYRLTNKFAQSEKTFLEAQQVCKKVIGEKTPEYANVLNSLGLLYNLMAEYQKSEKHHLESLAIFAQTRGKKHPEYAMVLHNMGILYTNMGLYEKAEKAFWVSLKIKKKALGVNHLDYGTSLGQLGLLYFYMGIYSKAVPLYQQDLKIKYNQYGKIHPHYANTLVNMGLVEYNVGNYNEAENLLTEALEIYEKTVGKNHRFYANCLQNLAGLYVDIGRYNKADVLYIQAEKTFARLLGPDHPSYASLLSGMGKFLYTLDKYAQAGNYFYTAMRIYEKKVGKNTPDYFTALLNLRGAYQAMDSVEVVDKYFKDIIPLAEKSFAKDPVTLASIYQNEGLDLYQKKKYVAAEKMLLKGLKLKETNIGKYNQSYTETLGNLANFYSLTSQMSKAKKQYLKYANHMLNYLIKQYPSMSEKDKNALLATNTLYIEDFKYFATQQAPNSPALFDKLFAFHTTTKGLSLSFAKKMRSLILQSQDTASLKTYSEWVASKEYLAKLYQLPKTTLKQRNLDLDQLERQSNELEKSLAKKFQGFANQLLLKQTTWQQIQQSLQPNELAIEVIRSISSEKVGKISYGIMLIPGDQRKRPQLIHLKNSALLESRYLKYYRQTAKFKRKDRFSYIHFWKSIQEAIAQLMPTLPKTIYFSADGCYNQINIQTLQNPQTKKYLLDQYQIYFVSSTKEIPGLKKGLRTAFASKNKAVLLGRPLYKVPEKTTPTKTSKQRGEKNFGSDRNQQQLRNVVFSDLPGTEKEVEQINQLLQNSNWQTTKLIGTEAREKQVKQVSNPDILHIATHGFFIPTPKVKRFGQLNFNFDLEYHGPMLRSGLILTGASNPNDVFATEDTNVQTEDGILTAYEVTNLRLEKTKLVVLSACETGLGDFRVGEGVYGLQRALKIAGAKNIVMSLWKVDDEATQELMVNFYRNLTQTNDLRQAFRSAQQQLKKKFPHPHFWGAFVLLGQ